jgi:hypothetical protein
MGCECGHDLETPDGKIIQVPKFAFVALKKKGLLDRRRAKLKPEIYDVLKHGETLLDGLGRILGSNLEGPEWCLCFCHDCLKARGQCNCQECRERRGA